MRKREGASVVSKSFLAGFGVAMVCLALAVAGILYMQRGAHIDLPGKILKIRTAPLDEASSIAVFDFRITNPADYTFEVRTVSVALEDAAGNRSDGMVISETDARQLFQSLPVLGQKYNSTLILRDKVPPHETQDRMVAARFEVPEAKLGSRKRFLITVEEVDGKVVEYSDR
jgi:hypothetical protein